MGHWARAPLEPDQTLLFYPTLRGSLAEDHPVHVVDEVLAQYDWTPWEREYVLVEGQPPIHPRYLAGAIVYGLSAGVRSSRALEGACRARLDLMLLVHGHTPDHTTFAKFRTRFQGPLKDLFRFLGRTAIEMGMGRLNGLALDGTRVRANSSRHATATAKTIEARLTALDEQVAGLAARGIEGYIPLEGRHDRPGNPAHRADPAAPVPASDWPRLPRSPVTRKLDRAAFLYDAAADVYWCPMGRRLAFHHEHLKRERHSEVRNRVYRSAPCGGCPLAGDCLAGKAGYRSVGRDEHEPLREAMDARLRTPEGRQTYGRRTWASETVFGFLKGVMGLRQFLLRGLDKVRTEWLWACATYNLAKLVRGLARRCAQASSAAG